MDTEPGQACSRTAAPEFCVGAELKTYTLYIHDDRYSVPSLDAVTVRDDARAREVGANRLTVSPHYQLIEVWEDDRFIDKFERA
jgi:hypothetical protein